MRILQVILFLSSFIGNTLCAQTSTKFTFRVALLNQSNKVLFDKHADIKGIMIRTYNDTPFAIYVYLDEFQKPNPKREFYDMLFEGDKYYFQQKYGELNISIPKLSIGEKVGNPNDFTERNSIKITKDSIFYDVAHVYVPNRTNRDFPSSGIGGPARPETKVHMIEKKLSDLYKNSQESGTIDSVIVFSATITKTGNLQDIKQIVGGPSKFATLVQAEFERPSEKWNPAIIRSAIESRTRIFARLNLDRSITITTPRVLGSFTGE